jgi:hypothetical protein
MWRKDSRDLVFVSPTGAFTPVPMRYGAEPSGSRVILFTRDPVRSATDQARFDMAPAVLGVERRADLVLPSREPSGQSPRSISATIRRNCSMGSS